VTNTDTLPLASGDSADAPAKGTRRRSGSGLSGMVLAELQQVAGGLGIKGTGRMRKGQLIEAIQAAQNGGSNGGTTSSSASAAAAPAATEGEAPARRTTRRRATHLRPAPGDRCARGRGPGRRAQQAPADAAPEARSESSRTDNRSDSPQR
jgi:transcription termination factor Rho